jgi:aarF domain-containing kinase
MPVAVKIQYPGVADSIDSDISILGTLLSPLAPRGLFLSTALAELREAMKAETGGPGPCTSPQPVL